PIVALRRFDGRHGTNGTVLVGVVDAVSADRRLGDAIGAARDAHRVVVGEPRTEGDPLNVVTGRGRLAHPVRAARYVRHEDVLRVGGRLQHVVRTGDDACDRTAAEYRADVVVRDGLIGRIHRALQAVVGPRADHRRRD